MYRYTHRKFFYFPKGFLPGDRDGDWLRVTLDGIIISRNSDTAEEAEDRVDEARKAIIHALTEGAL